MKATVYNNGQNVSCFPETEFEKELFGCDYIAISKQESEEKLPHFVFWYETPDLSHLKRGEKVPALFNPEDAVDCPDEFRNALERELSDTDGIENLVWDGTAKRWENIPLAE